jgi:membrane-bound serine protease (ClpP class)
VIDLIAESLPDLLAKVDGRKVRTPNGVMTLATHGASVDAIQINFRDRVLNVITDPNVAYILMMLGTLGLLFELSNPGAILPGVVGGISLILTFFAFQSLPVNYAGILLILFGLALLVAEIKVVSHGILAMGGIVAMALGSLMLYDVAELSLRVSWWVMLPTVGVTAGLFFFVLTFGLRALRGRPMLGAPALIGETGVARELLAPTGHVAIHGELWRATAEGGVAIDPGTRVRVIGVEGLTINVVKDDSGGGSG